MPSLMSRRSRLSSAFPLLPAALVALVGDDAVARGVKRARAWAKRNVSRGIPESLVGLKPAPRTLASEWRKTEKLKGVIPFYPAVPLIPLAAVLGLATASTVMAARGRRRDRAITARLDALETEMALLREQRARREQVSGEPPTADLPWS